MAVPFSNTTLRVPLGFPSLLEGLSREVLRHQPKDIFGFAERYFEGLLRKREETGTEDIAQLTSRLYDRYYNNQAYCRLHLSSSDAEQKKAAVTIQTEYRRHHAQLQTEEVRKEIAAVHIQSCYRGYRTRKALRTGDSGQQTWAEKVEYPRKCKGEDNFISDEEASPEASIQTQSEGLTSRKSYHDQNPETERSVLKRAFKNLLAWNQTQPRNSRDHILLRLWHTFPPTIDTLSTPF
ncbi:hypothetical protein CRM22_001108 [Opisthorchis felineus]|uniref:RIIa domain-containing protein n=1 Tax=Opisthorchis felineus TaxID=147828 RepID=A0A4V6RH80_OPIFE|nr:hypothetical protein CRM22_001108 [Opisthorchis felineus]